MVKFYYWETRTDWVELFLTVSKTNGHEYINAYSSQSWLGDWNGETLEGIFNNFSDDKRIIIKKIQNMKEFLQEIDKIYPSPIDKYAYE